MEQQKTHWSSNRHGLIFDVTVLVGWTVLLLGGKAISGLDEALSSSPENLPVPQRRTIGLLLAGGIAAQMLGSMLKAPWLGRRLHAQRTALPGNFLSLFWWLHLIYFLVVTCLCLGLFGWWPDDREITLDYMLWGMVVLAVGGTTTLAVKSAATPRNATAARAPAAEFLGDGLLSLSALLLTSVTWEPISSLLMENQVTIEAGIWNWIARVAVVLCTLVLFLAFYLPARILFLIEDARLPATWAQIGCVLLPLAWHMLSH